MSDFSPDSRIRVISFTVTLVPGETTVQNATAYYEVVFPSKRAAQFNLQLDLSDIQKVVDAAAASIVGQLLTNEKLTQIWPRAEAADTVPIVDGDPKP